MNALAQKNICKAWSSILKHIPLKPITSEKEYGKAVEALNHLLDIVKSDEAHPLSDILHVLGSFISEFEKTQYPISEAGGADMVHYFMLEHHLKQADLADILGGQSVVSAVLSGKRSLNIKQVHKLAEKFGVSPQVFL